MERRLAAILAADVVGYTRLMGADEAGTLERLKAIRTTLVQPLIAEHGGRVAKVLGDGLLAEFPSAAGAVRCAIDVQQALAEREAAASDERRVRLRIGINLGDLIVEGTDIYGDGVNIATRLEGQAEPGGICLSSAVFAMLGPDLGTDFEDTGPQTLKNVDRPVRVYRWTRAARLPEPRPPPQPSTGDRPSVAVLPFTNMSGDPAQEYFSDGITEDLITELSRFRELAVISRNSSFVFKGGRSSLREVGAKLGVQYLVEGSVQRAGERVRVTAQLIDTESDTHVWAERYERGLEDIFAVQDDIVRRVASTLAYRLGSVRHEQIRHQSAERLRAYDLYLRGREHFFNWTQTDNRQAVALLRAALEAEPEDAGALALLSEALLRMWLNAWSERPAADLAESFALAQAADELDDQDSRTQTALGIAWLFQRDLGRARRHFEAALRLNPNDMRVLIYYSRHAVFDGDPERAVALARQALTLNPYGRYNYNLGVASFVARQYPEAIALLESIRNPPESVSALLAASLAMAGEAERAAATSALVLDAARRSPVMSRLAGPAAWTAFFSERWPFRSSQDFEHLRGALRHAGLPLA